jgi:hypothetical protein
MDNRRRAESGQGWSGGVRIREVGAPAGSEHAYSSEAFPPEDGGAPGNYPQPRRRNSPFLAAWIFTGILIGIGFLWLGGALEDGSIPDYGYTVTMDPETGLPVQPDTRPLEVQLRNLGFIAPFMLLIGVSSAAALLALQGVRKAQLFRVSAPEQESQQR